MVQPQISVVLPVFEERESLEPLLQEITAVLHGLPYEIVAVDDRSRDGSLDELRRLRARYPALRVLMLDRHRGQSAALAAGFDASRGEFIVTMDADGQNDPSDIPEFLAVLQRDAHYVATVGYRACRRDTAWKRLQSRMANAVRNVITGDAVRDTGCSLRVLRRDAIARLPRFDGMHRFLPTLVRLATGGEVVELPARHRPRLHGQSKYGMWNRAWRGLRDAFGVRWLRRRRLRYSSEEVVE